MPLDLFLINLFFSTELLERVPQVFGQDVPDVGIVHVGRQGQRLGQKVGAIARCADASVRSQPK